MARWVGGDGPEIRSALIEALSQVARPQSAEPPTASALEARVAEVAGTDVAAARGLLQDLVLHATFVRDEDEEQGPPPGDYAAEESGF